MHYEERTIKIYDYETGKHEHVKQYRKGHGNWLYVTEEMEQEPKSQMGYYAIGEDDCFTDSSPYRYRESAIYEAKQIHGENFDYEKHVEEHITDAFYVMFLEDL